jgi:hypothetical protein
MPVDNPPAVADNRSLYALITAIMGLAIPAFLIGYLTVKNPVVKSDTRMWAASEIVAAAGLFTSIVGTLVGAFLGVQVGEMSRQRSEETTRKAIYDAALAQVRLTEAVRLLPEGERHRFL